MREQSNFVVLKDNNIINPNQRAMNKFRREQLSEILGKLEVLKEELEELKEEECLKNK